MPTTMLSNNMFDVLSEKKKKKKKKKKKEKQTAPSEAQKMLLGNSATIDLVGITVGHKLDDGALPYPPESTHGDDGGDAARHYRPPHRRDGKRPRKGVATPPRPETFSLWSKGENVLDGLGLWCDVVDESLERELIAFTNNKLRLGRARKLQGQTYMQSTWTDPVTRKRGKGREVLQFGSFYDYAVHNIDPENMVEKMPSIIEKLIDRLIALGSLPAESRPDTCIVNVYGVGDNIPPHIDHLAYPRPFSTLSLESEAAILFGRDIKPLGGGRFKAPFSTILPRRSLLVLERAGANKAKHCIPNVTARRISFTLRQQPAWAKRRNEEARLRSEQGLPARRPNGNNGDGKGRKEKRQARQKRPAGKHTRFTTAASKEGTATTKKITMPAWTGALPRMLVSGGAGAASSSVSASASVRGAPRAGAGAGADLQRVVVRHGLVFIGGVDEWILEGRKTLETRGFALEPRFVGKPVGIVRILRRSDPNIKAWGTKKVLVGVAWFEKSSKYKSKKAWAADSAQHCVDPEDSTFGWKNPKYKWPIVRQCKVVPVVPVFDEDPQRRAQLFKLSKPAKVHIHMRAPLPLHGEKKEEEVAGKINIEEEDGAMDAAKETAGSMIVDALPEELGDFAKEIRASDEKVAEIEEARSGRGEGGGGGDDEEKDDAWTENMFDIYKDSYMEEEAEHTAVSTPPSTQATVSKAALKPLSAQAMVFQPQQQQPQQHGEMGTKHHGRTATMKRKTKQKKKKTPRLAPRQHSPRGPREQQRRQQQSRRPPQLLYDPSSHHGGGGAGGAYFNNNTEYTYYYPPQHVVGHAHEYPAATHEYPAATHEYALRPGHQYVSHGME